MNNKFFFDTANADFILNTWKQIKPICNNPKNILGVTTNPNALNKAGVKDLNSFLVVVYSLFDIIGKIRNDDLGIVYVQIPNSQCSLHEVKGFVDLIKSLFNFRVRIGLKIPPRFDIIQNKVWFEDLLPNVTGVTDALTAVQMLSFNVEYISFLTGRLEEAWVDVKSHIAFVNSCQFDKKQIIAGSMRTIPSLELAFQMGCVPTIGEKLWYGLLEGNNKESLNKDYTTLDDRVPSINFSDCAVWQNVQNQFFQQMDEAGRVFYNSIKKQIV